MIGDIFFVIRMLLLTCLLVVLFQVRIGTRTLEQHSHAWLQSSQAAAILQDVAGGAVLLLDSGYQKFSQVMGTHLDRLLGSEASEASKNIGVQIDRSRTYLEKQAQSLKAIEAFDSDDEAPSSDNP